MKQSEYDLVQVHRKVRKGEQISLREARALCQDIIKKEATIEVLRFELACAVNDLRAAGIYGERASVTMDKGVDD